MRLYEFFKERASDGRPLVLVTVFETAGSTYSKAGGQMIIDGDGHYCGMLSGGCLEGDLVERARAVIGTGESQTATYNLGADDELWGLGVGCDGTMRVLLQPLTRETDYQPFTAIADTLQRGHSATIAIVVRAETPSIEVGASVVFQETERLCFGMSDEVAASIANDVDDSEITATRHVHTPEARCTVLYASIEPPPSVLVLGAGPDSEPVVRIASELGWRCTVSDHRPAYVENRSYPEPTRALCCAADELSGRLNPNGFDVAIVMSHHLASDRSYLRQLAASDVGYIGLLGPPGRRGRLVDELGDEANALRGRLHGPAGMQLGGRGPGPIALEIVAEMQQFLARRDEA